MKLRSFGVLMAALFVIASAYGGPPTLAAETTESPPVPAAMPLTAEAQDRFIVQFAAQPLALYDGGVAGLAPTMPAARGELRLDPDSADSAAYYTYLDAQQATQIAAIEAALGRSVDVVFRYRTVYNGIAVSLTPTEAQTVRGLSGVTRVDREQTLELLTDNGPAWMNADEIWDGSATGVSSKGEGIVAGVIDTGINPDHPSFADIGADGYDHSNPRLRHYGVCAPLNPLLCNDKLIGMYDFSGTGHDDDNGHGSHTASTVAGNVVDATVYAPTTTVGPRLISGVAPHANVISYKACTDRVFVALTGCQLTALYASIEQATIDKVDVINFSIGGGSQDPWTGIFAQPFFGTQAAGVFVAASAGNAGPGPQTIGAPSNAPWLMSVGASTHARRPSGTVTTSSAAGAGPSYTGMTVAAGLGSTALVDAKDVGNELCNPFNADQSAQVAGKLVICTQGVIGRVAKGANVKAAGGAGMILTSQPGAKASVVADTHVLPTVMISEWDGEALRAWLATAVAPSAALSGVSLEVNSKLADRMAYFSSRGPDLSSPNVIKPDVTAPGVAIWAAFASHSGPAGTAEYNVIQGTSMSSPHAAGAAVLVRALNPLWTPDNVKSALMSTGFTSPAGGKEIVAVTKEDHTTRADPFDMGGGRVDVARAVKAGIVMQESLTGYQDANPAAGGDPRQINLASFADNNCEISCSWTRTLTSAAATPVTWTVTTSSSSGFTLSATPASFTLDGTLVGLPIATQDITVSAGNAGLKQGVWEFGSVTFTPSDPALPVQTFPVAVRGAEAPVVAPCEIPETVVVSDPAGDNLSGHPSQDVREIAITGAYPTFRGAPTPNLVFRMKVADLSELLPNSIWRTVFTVPGATPANWFVEMEVSDASGNVAFNYGNQTTGFSTLGPADHGEYTTDGNIIITVATAKVGNPVEGTTLTGIFGRAETLVGAAGTGGLATIDRAPNSGGASYTVAGCGDTGPIANADRATTSDGTPVVIDVLANDVSSDGSELTVTSVEDPANGTATNNGDGTITYLPDAGFSGSDSFTYTISDGQGRTASALVSVTVAPFCPTTSRTYDFESGGEGWSVETAANELGNELSPNWEITTDLLASSGTNSFHSSGASGADSDDTTKDDRLIGPAVQLTSVSTVSFWHRYWFELNFDGGVLEVSTDGGETWRDVTDPNIGGVFTKGGYTGTIAPGGSAIQGRDAWTGEESTAVTGAMRETVLEIGTLAGSTATFRWRLVTDPLVPSLGWWVDDVTFGGLATDCNEPPVANADEAVTTEDTAVTIAVLANDTDPDNDTLTVSGASDPANGSVTVNADNTVTYTPDAGFVGTDTFSYTAFDGEWEDTATVTVTVEERPNTAPVANDDSVTTARNTAVDIAVLANDHDADGDALTITSFTQPAQGWVTDNGDGTLRYEPPLNFSGSESFSYTIDDAHGGSATGDVTVNVGEPGAPIACFTTSPKRPTADSNVTFFGKCTSDDTDSDEDLTFSWDFESDGVIDTTGIKPHHTYVTAGTYRVTLRVTDTDGNTDVLKRDLVVRP
ncbi:MAG: Ig-like domain-containing protein [Dehalococcoidia bacterium]